MDVQGLLRLLDERPWLYHFTDVENLPLIREHGLLSYSELESRGIVPPKPGGNDWSRDADRIKGVDQYVHLCFLENHPMEYLARKENHIGETKFLQVSTSVLGQDGVMGCIGVANCRDTVIMPLEEVLDQMDLEILFGGWIDFTNRELRSRYNEAKKAEILIPRHIPVEKIMNLG